VNAFGQTEITVRSQRRKQIEALKYETDLAPANVCAFGIGGRSQVFTIDYDATVGRRQQATKQVQHGRLAAS
jgi:hypothetical protein